MSFVDHYTTAVHARSLRSNPDTTRSDSDVLGAAGLASKRVPLGIGLMRLFAGDNNAAPALVEILADTARDYCEREKIKVRHVEQRDIAQVVLRWFRESRCDPCHGRGKLVIPGTTTLRDTCKACKGAGRKSFDRQFHGVLQLAIARHLRDRIEREQGMAGAEAMKALAPRLELP